MPVHDRAGSLRRRRLEQLEEEGLWHAPVHQQGDDGAVQAGRGHLLAVKDGREAGKALLFPINIRRAVIQLTSSATRPMNEHLLAEQLPMCLKRVIRSPPLKERGLPSGE